MSWSAYLYDDRGHTEGDWGYTHNTNGMIEDALGADSIEATGQPWWSRLAANKEQQEAPAPLAATMGRGAWWDLLDGATGEDGAQLLARIIAGLKAKPDYYRALNPGNGWGDYDSLVAVLTEMHDAVPEWPTRWDVSG